MNWEAACRWALLWTANDGRKRYVFGVRTFSGEWSYRVSTAPRTVPRDPFIWR